MIKNVLTIVLLSALSFAAQSQAYYSSSIEWIFSEAHASNGDGNTSEALSTRLRFSPIISIQNIINYDLSPKVGAFSGFNVRNVGYITNNEYWRPEKELVAIQYDRAIRRTYNAGIPLGLKLGNLDKEFFVYGGVEAELAFNYRERLYEGDSKSVRSEWFGNEATMFNPSWFVGINLPNGIALTYKTYFNNFFDKGYTRSDGTKPYENYNVKVHYISLNFYLFSNFKKTYLEAQEAQKNNAPKI